MHCLQLLSPWNECWQDRDVYCFQHQGCHTAPHSVHYTCGIPTCSLHSLLVLCFPLPSRFAAGEYLDAAFLTKLMCCGRELHDFLTLPAQVGRFWLGLWLVA